MMGIQVRIAVLEYGKIRNSVLDSLVVLCLLDIQMQMSDKPLDTLCAEVWSKLESYISHWMIDVDTLCS